MSLEPTLEQRWAEVSGRISQAATKAGRDPLDIITIVVTKFHPASLVRELAQLGVRHVGENRHQEAVAKHAELSDCELTWHFVGQLQSNKAKAVVEYCDVVHSVDRPSLVTSLSGQSQSVDVFVEINLTDVPGRGGVEPDALEGLAEAVLKADNLRLRGVMAVAPQNEDPLAAFERVVAYSARVQALAPDAIDLSIGMSGDFEEAISVGATHLRIGAAITGKRPLAT
jgi:pyridoxal phosphate enzyme (YggS family)